MIKNQYTHFIKITSTFSIALLCLSLLSLPRVSFAGADGFYLGLLGGVTLTKDLANTYLGMNSNLPPGVKIKYKPGYVFGGMAGVRGGPLRVELEVKRINADFKSILVGNTTVATIEGGLTKATFFLANIILGGTGTVGPYAGAGVGFSNTCNELNFTNGNNNEDSQRVFAYQFLGGLALNLNETLSIFTDYRYVATNRVSAIGKSFSNHTVNLGAIITFG